MDFPDAEEEFLFIPFTFEDNDLIEAYMFFSALAPQAHYKLMVQPGSLFRFQSTKQNKVASGRNVLQRFESDIGFRLRKVA